MQHKHSFSRKFCIAGPVIPSRHYFVTHRLDWDQLITLIGNRQYFVLHTPQSGKTSAIDEFIHYMNGNDIYKVLYINIEDVQAARDNVEVALISVISILKNAIKEHFKEDHEVVEQLQKLMKEQPVTLDLFRQALSCWARVSTKPIVLFIDEIDSLIGDSLLSILRQIRAGFKERPHNFPQSICLIGLRDVRDYRIWSKKQDSYVSTSSPFNIKAISLTLSNFTHEQVKDLYNQHTQATGQEFTPEAIEYAFYLTQGQPWLVNALAQEACFVLVIDRSKAITKEIIEDAKDILIKRKDTHIDSLLDKLNESRVAAVIDAIISGAVTSQQFTADDVQYCNDLGLLSSTAQNYQIANPIYQQIIPAVLASKFQESIAKDIRSYIRADGSLDMGNLIESFTQFYRENSQTWLKGYSYHEAGPHILMLAFLQRIINGGGHIQREYALGNRRVDLFIVWKEQKFVLELKIKRSEKVLAKGLEQIADYMDKAEGHLIFFDRSPDKTWEQKISNETLCTDSKQVHVWTIH